MRRQDELKVLYPRQDRYNRKFILSELDEHARTFDSEELLELLQSESLNPDPLIRHQALFSLLLFLPGFVRRRYGIDAASTGVWTRYRDLKSSDPDAPGDPGGSAAGTEDAVDRRRQRAVLALGPLVDPLRKALDSGDPDRRTRARLAVAQVPFRSAQTDLLGRFRDGAGDVEDLLALMRAGGGAEHATELGELLIERGRTHPSLALAMVGLPLPQLTRQAPRVSPALTRLGRVNLATALGKVSDASHSDWLTSLATSAEPWLAVQGLRALGRLGLPRTAGTLASVAASSPHAFLRLQAVRALGFVRSPTSIEACQVAVRSRHPGLQSQGLESLIRLGCPPDTLAAIAAPLTSSPMIHCRVNALLATHDPRAGAVPAGFDAVLRSRSALERLEAVYALGFWQTIPALKHLAATALLDPEPGVAIQAVKSLSKYPAPAALKGLLPVLREREDRVAATAAIVMARYEGEEARAICAALMARMKEPRGTVEKCLIYRILGAVGGKLGLTKLEPVLETGFAQDNPAVLRGVLEGWQLYGSAREGDIRPALTRLEKGADPHLASLARTVSLLQGDTGAIDRLAAELDRPDPGRAFEEARQVGLLMNEVVPENRFPALTAALEATPAPESPDPELSLCWRLSDHLPDEFTAGTADPEADLPARRLDPARLDPSSADASSSPAGEEVASLFEDLRNRSRPSEALADKVGAATYVVDPAFRETAMAAEERFSAWPAPLRRLAVFFSVNRILMVPFACLGVITLVVGLSLIVRGTGYRRPALYPKAFVASRVQGRVLLEPQKVPLKIGSVIRLKDRVHLPPEASVDLLSSRGGRLSLAGGTDLTAAKASASGDKILVRVEPGGDLELDFRHAESLIVRAGGWIIGCVEGRGRIRTTETEVILAPEDGAFRCRTEDGPLDRLENGREHRLPREVP